MDYFIHDWCELNLTFWQRSALYDTHLATPNKKMQTAMDSTLKYYNRDKQEPEKLYDPQKKSTQDNKGSKDISDKTDSGNSQDTAYLHILAQLENKNERNYVFALDFYFRLYKDYLMAVDCSKHAKELMAHEQN